MIVRRSALVDRSAEQLFDLIEAAEHYPKFLPWCSGADIVARDDSIVSADLRVRWAGLDFAMRTRNPKRRPEYMAIHLERGPFKRFEGEWLLSALTPQACKVAFTLDWEFDSAMVTRVAGPVFARIADTLMDAFVQRAATLAPVAGGSVVVAVPMAQQTAPPLSPTTAPSLSLQTLPPLPSPPPPSPSAPA